MAEIVPREWRKTSTGCINRSSEAWVAKVQERRLAVPARKREFGGMLLGRKGERCLGKALRNALH